MGQLYKKENENLNLQINWGNNCHINCEKKKRGESDTKVARKSCYSRKCKYVKKTS